MCLLYLVSHLFLALNLSVVCRASAWCSGEGVEGGLEAKPRAEHQHRVRFLLFLHLLRLSPGHHPAQGKVDVTFLYLNF